LCFKGDLAMLTTTALLTFDGRDLSDRADPDEVLGFGLLHCPHCGTMHDSRYPYCCEFAAEPAPEPLLIAH
jgi:hypothetical protein